MDENISGDVDTPPSSASRETKRNYRDAVVGRKFTDRASLLLQEQLASTFVVTRSILSSSEISSRKLRAAHGSLTAEECAEKASLMQGVLPIAQWSPAQWALFSKAELTEIGNSRFRDSSARFVNTIYFVEQVEGSFSYLFPTEERVQRSRSQLEQALREAWAATMGGPQAVEFPRDIIEQVVLSKINLSAAVSRPALRVQMQGPTDVLSKFMEGLDALPFFGEWPASASRKIAFTIIHKPRSAVVRVRAHPKDAPVLADELAFRLRLRLLEEEEEAELLSFGTEKFSSTVSFLLNCPALPRCLLSSPSLVLESGDQVPLSFPDGPPSCAHCYSLTHSSLECSQRPLPPARRVCGICKKLGCASPCPSLRRERRCFFCDATDHLISQCPEILCRYCHLKGHKARDCPQAAAAKATRAAARVASSSEPSKAARLTPPAAPPSAPAHPSGPPAAPLAPDRGQRQPPAQGPSSVPGPAAVVAHNKSISVPPPPLRPGSIQVMPTPTSRAHAGQGQRALSPPPSLSTPPTGALSSVTPAGSKRKLTGETRPVVAGSESVGGDVESPSIDAMAVDGASGAAEGRLRSQSQEGFDPGVSPSIDEMAGAAEGSLRFQSQEGFDPGSPDIFDPASASVVPRRQ